EIETPARSGAVGRGLSFGLGGGRLCGRGLYFGLGGGLLCGRGLSFGLGGGLLCGRGLYFGFGGGFFCGWGLFHGGSFYFGLLHRVFLSLFRFAVHFFINHSNTCNFPSGWNPRALARPM
ncbi:MAG: hypothetical protein MK554_09535, partial [Planctomycetes bacterium]|nr:hypothetical protein [Planctomycetota bacterium]